MRIAVYSESPGSATRVCRLGVRERCLRTLEEAGVDEVVVVETAASARTSNGRAADAPGRPRNMIVRHYTTPGPRIVPADVVAALDAGGEAVLLVPGDVVLDRRSLEALLDRDEPGVAVDSAPPAELAELVRPAPRTSAGLLVGAAVVSPAWLAGRRGPLRHELGDAVDDDELPAVDLATMRPYVPSLRRHQRPCWFPAPEPGEPGAASRRAAAERFLVRQSRKSVQDLPAYVHAPIENALVRWLCRTPVTPNQLTLAVNVAAWVATWLFLTGRVGTGLALALAVGVLDGLDGKLARVTHTTSALGKLEHWFDFLYEFSWWIALAFHFRASGALPWAWLAFGGLAAAEAVDGLAKLWSLRRTGRSIYEHGPADRIVRLLGGRRNVYVWILTVGALAGRPASAYALLPLWQGATAAYHLARLATLAGRDDGSRRTAGDAADSSDSSISTAAGEAAPGGPRARVDGGLGRV